jgi:hypothetical protein
MPCCNKQSLHRPARRRGTGRPPGLRVRGSRSTVRRVGPSYGAHHHPDLKPKSISDLRALCASVVNFPGSGFTVHRSRLGTLWHAKRTVPEGRLENRPALQRRLLTIPNPPRPGGSGEPLGLKMIPTTSFAEKSDQASRFFVLNRSSSAASPRPFGTGDPFLFLSTGAEAPAYSRSTSPRRRRFSSPAIRHASPVPVVSVLTR